MSNDARSIFTSSVPKSTRKKTIPVCRSSKKKWGLNVHVLAISRHIVCAALHHKGRTYPCREPMNQTCSFCDSNHLPRHYGYFAAWHIQREIHVIVEVTHAVAEQLSQFVEEEGSLRGQLITLSRHNDAANGHLVCQIKKSKTAIEQIPESFDLEGALLRMWGMHKLDSEAESPAVNPESPSAMPEKTNGHPVKTPPAKPAAIPEKSRSTAVEKVIEEFAEACQVPTNPPKYLNGQRQFNLGEGKHS